MPVSPEDRRIWELQVAALRDEESFDEGTPELRAAVTAGANRWRAAHGMEPLKGWLEDKGEARFHERARALGLLDSQRRPSA